jgi:hypothetical protein
MKQIIEGRRYDTEAPQTTLILDDLGPGNLSRRDHQYWRAGLYRTGKGNLFLAGEGGPASMFAESVGSARTGGSGIIPLDPDRARELLEQEGPRGTEAIETIAEMLKVSDA